MRVDTKKEEATQGLDGDKEKQLLEQNESVKKLNATAEYIQNGANTFLLSEYIYLSIFLLLFAVILVAIDDWKFYTAIAFLLGSATSIVSGYIGMYVATRTNLRVTYLAATIPDDSISLKEAFNCAFRGGCVMGFMLVSLGLSILTIIIIIYFAIYGPNISDPNRQFSKIFDYIAGYGLGGSTVALFCRVGGGIYTKAADVGADLVGKNEFGLDEDSPDNPATIADNVGDNVGDIAGMGSDLFGSFAESTCAALVVSGTSPQLVRESTFMFPLLLTAGGILICIVTSFFATNVITVTTKQRIETSLRGQLIISSVLLTPTIILLALFTLPSEFYFGVFKSANWKIMVCALLGLWSGLAIGYITDFFTSTHYAPVQKLAVACKSGAAINIIHGLALGYLSTIIPILSLSSILHFKNSYYIYFI